MMDTKICLVVCENFGREVAHITENQSSAGVVVKEMPANCRGPLINPEALRDLLHTEGSRYQKVILIGGACVRAMRSKEIRQKNLSVNETLYCFDLLANEKIIGQYINEGNYLVSGGWFRSYQNRLTQWGFDERQARNFFGESAKAILYLDTGIYDDYAEALKRFSDYTGLSAGILQVGLDHCRLIVDGIISEALEEAGKRRSHVQLLEAMRMTADYSMAFHHINEMVALTDERAIALKLAELVNLLFAPALVIYKPCDGPLGDETLAFDGSNKFSEIPPGSDFSISLDFQDNCLAYINIQGVGFPEHLAHYKELSNIISKVGGLAVSNSRKFGIIEDNKVRIERDAALLREMNATKDKFFSIIAHDLRGPFQTILGLLQELQENNESYSGDETKELLGIIRNSSESTLKLLENLLEWARIQGGGSKINPQWFRINEIITELMLFTKPAAGKKAIELSAVGPEDLEVFADKDSVSLVIRNLLVNAIKFTHQGGKIKVIVVTEGNNVRVSVTDNGIGIQEDMLGKLFRVESGYKSRGTANEPGTGLGLVLCREHIEKHGGKIWAESLPGAGSTFSFSIPRVYSPQQDL